VVGARDESLERPRALDSGGSLRASARSRCLLASSACVARLRRTTRSARRSSHPLASLTETPTVRPRSIPPLFVSLVEARSRYGSYWSLLERSVVAPLSRRLTSTPRRTRLHGAGAGERLTPFASWNSRCSFHFARTVPVRQQPSVVAAATLAGFRVPALGAAVLNDAPPCVGASPCSRQSAWTRTRSTGRTANHLGAGRSDPRPRRARLVDTLVMKRLARAPQGRSKARARRELSMIGRGELELR